MTPRLLTLTDDRYHADDIGQDRPSLSASVATVLVNESPYHAWLRHPKLGKCRREASREMARGTVIHSLLFKEPLDDIIIIDAENYRTKTAQTERDFAVLNGCTPILRHEFEDAKIVADEIDGKLLAAGFARMFGAHEQVVTWEEGTAHGPILCRGKMDYVEPDIGLILDLKNISSASPKNIARSVVEHGYDVQWAAYTSAFQKLKPHLAGREDFVWLFVETLPEGSPERTILTVARPDGSMRECGRVRWSKACETWAKCMSENHWPGYGEIRVECPGWMMKEMEVGA